MLQALQRWIEATYRLEPETPVSEYLIDRELLFQHLEPQNPYRGAEEVLLIANQGEEYQLGLYLDPELLNTHDEPEHAEQAHPVLTVLEGVSHFLLVLHRLKGEVSLTQLELELQAEIDKFLFFRLRPAAERREEAQSHLRRPANLSGLSEGQRETYETARRLACRYCLQLERDYLSAGAYDALYRELRHFYRQSHWQKLHSLGPP